MKRKSKKINFDDTMMDPKLIGNYKDEIDIEIAEQFGLDCEIDATNTMSHHSNKEIKGSLWHEDENK